MIELKMNKNYNYIVTKEMIEEGKKHGLSRRNLYDRLYRGSCDTIEDLFKPKQQRHDYSMYHEILKANHISSATFRRRLKVGWSLEKALYTPVDETKSHPKMHVIKEGSI